MPHVFSKKFNAARSAKAAGLPPDAVVKNPDGAGFVVNGLPDKPAKAPAPPKAPRAAKPKAKPKAKPAARKAKAPKAAKASDGLPREGSKNRKLVDLLLRPNGAAMAEMLKATGWKKCSGTMATLAAKHGLKLTRHPGAEGKASRWSATR